jgi:hypothetical protein
MKYQDVNNGLERIMARAEEIKMTMLYYLFNRKYGSYGIIL